jgi:hypothetical protein
VLLLSFYLFTKKKNHVNMCHNYEVIRLFVDASLNKGYSRWPQSIALLHWGQGCIDPNISRIQFYPLSGKQRFLLADLGLYTESSIPLSSLQRKTNLSQWSGIEPRVPAYKKIFNSGHLKAISRAQVWSQNCISKRIFYYFYLVEYRDRVTVFPYLHVN